MNWNKLLQVSCAAAALAWGAAHAQPVAKPGTEMVPNEYGSTFPREITWGKDGAEMVLIPYGAFTRGRDGGPESEAPAREITLPSFYIDKYEVSNSQFRKFMGERSAPLPRPTGDPLLAAPEHPVAAVPFNSADKYADWAGKQLPTEAMWEKAARGPDANLYTTGPTAESTRGKLVIGQGPRGVTVPATKDTGDISAYGAYHMGGNLQEWTQDFYDRNYYLNSPEENPMGPATGESKSVRGGSFFGGLEEATTTHRRALPRSQVRDEVGFRTVWVPQPVEKEVAQATPTPLPEIDRDAVVRDLIKKVEPHLRNQEAKLPSEYMANRAFMNQGFANIQYVNFTPFRISLTFVGPDQEAVFKYNEPLPAMSFRNVSLPREVDLFALAYPIEKENGNLVNLGFIRAESGATVVLPTELFAEVVDPGGNPPAIEGELVKQYYNGFNPQWNEIEVYNPLDQPILVNIQDITRNRDTPEPVADLEVPADKIMRLQLPPKRYLFKVDYIGALDESSDPLELTLDDSAARRLLTIRQDTMRPGGVFVITEELPYLRLDLTQARRIAGGGA